MNHLLRVLCLVVALLFVSTAFAENKPKLILQITVDQLRGDLPTRYYDRLGEGGFRYLWESGIVYTLSPQQDSSCLNILG